MMEEEPEYPKDVIDEYAMEEELEFGDSQASVHNDELQDNFYRRKITQAKILDRTLVSEDKKISFYREDPEDYK